MTFVAGLWLLAAPVMLSGMLSGMLSTRISSVPSGTLSGAQGSETDHERRAREWMAQNGLVPDQVEDLEGLLSQGLARATLGIFEVYFPTEALADPHACADIGRSLDALVQTGVGWLRWLPPRPGSSSRADLEKKLAPFTRWLAGWKPALFSDPGALRGQDLGTLDLDDKVERAWELADSELELCDPIENEGGLERVRIVLLPRRVDFIDVVSAVGLCQPAERAYAWVDGIVHWTSFDLPALRFIALQHPATTARDNPLAGIRLDSKNPKGLEEHVAQLAARSLLDRVYGQRLEPALAAGIANELVIELFGEVDTRTDGDLRSRATQERSVFVPGAASDGFLPPDSAETRWRSGQGKDHFVVVLRQSQEQGAGEAREPWEKKTGFQLLADDGSEKVVVRAPFLGPEGGAPPAPNFRGDYVEFLRAYSVAFLHWLRNEENNASKVAHENFGKVLAKLALADDAGALADLIVEVYEMPLSAEDGENLYRLPTLEGRFLEWLAKK